jgi:hypothetical protein
LLSVRQFCTKDAKLLDPFTSSALLGLNRAEKENKFSFGEYQNQLHFALKALPVFLLQLTILTTFVNLCIKWKKTTTPSSSLPPHPFGVETGKSESGTGP